MYKIVKKEILSENIFLIDVRAPRITDRCLPGQFVIVRADEKGERIPLTICDYDRETGNVTLVVQIIGASTLKLSRRLYRRYRRSFRRAVGTDFFIGRRIEK